MIDNITTISEIIATYQKHGWILRRVLLSAELKSCLDKEIDSLFRSIQIANSTVDAAWFSRPPKAGGVAWELRYLGDPPLAMLEKADEADPAFENALKNVEVRLIEAVAAKEAA